MPAATSSRLDAVDVMLNGKRVQLVLRRFDDHEWLGMEPDLVAHEAAALAWASNLNVAVPTLIAFDADGMDCGVPATLTTKLPGAPQLKPLDRATWIAEMAAAAVEIHRLDADGFPWSYRRYNAKVRLEIPPWTRERDAWATAIEVVNGPAPRARDTFIHRDYHPSNLVWENDKVSGVVDWVNACRGPAGIDVAWCRHNLANLYSVEMADEFLDAYVDAAGPGFTYDPYWDLMSVVELLPGPPKMYAGWKAEGFPTISDEVMRQRVDRYVASVAERLE
jgi:aminoglycoside phosphotransferase (APT) family kinase protein